MSNTINIGGIKVSKFYLGGSSDVKIYLGTTKLYPHLQEPCFAVVDNISTYTARTYVDVFNESDGLWYKLNNLDEYEKYGVYGSGRTITYYNGKLTIDSGYEYQYSGGSWNNVGEVSGSSRLPDGYTEIEYIENTSQAYINLGIDPYSATNNSFTVESTFSSYTQSNLTYLISSEYTNQPYNGFVARWNGRSIELVGNSVGVDTTAQNIPNGDGTSAITFHSDSTTTNNGNTPITLFSGLNRNSPWRYGKGRLYALKMTLNNSVVRELVPAKRDSDSKYGMYDIANDVFYLSSNNYNFTGGSATGQIVYPMYYDEIQDPLDNLTFSSMTEAESYECPWVGMHATINGDKYVFSGDSVSGYEWVYNPSRLPDGYTEIEYIENTSQAYINLNINPTDAIGNSFVIESKLLGEWFSGGGTLEYLISNEQGNASPYYGFGIRLTNGNPEVLVSDETNITTGLTLNSDSTSSFTLNVSSPSRSNTTPITLFCGLQGSTVWRNGRGKLYSFKLTLNNSVVRELVPAMRDSDSKYGMYDIVNDVFYLSSNSYNFSGGNPI